MNYRSVIQHSLDYIEDHLQTELTAKELAMQAGFSLYHFYRLFQAATGFSVMHYILRRRLLHAVYEIRCNQTGIETALAYGFGTYAGFYKAFRREFGCTPLEFINDCRARRPYRPNLFTEEYLMITHKKAAKLLTYWNLENETVSDIYYEGTGNKCGNAFSIGTSHILKFTSDFGKLQKHLQLSKAISDVGLCAAVPIPTVTGETYIQEGDIWFYLTPRLSGKQITSEAFYQQGGSKKARFAGEILGQLHAALSGLDCCINDADTLEALKTRALPKVQTLLDLPEHFCRRFTDSFISLYPKLPRQLIHRDPNPGNILYSEDTWGFIDFELSEKNARIYDPCYAATAILSETFSAAKADTAQKWLEIYQNILLGYDSVAKLTEDEWLAIPYMILANQFICVAWFSQQEKYTEIYETNRNMTLWLVNNFEKLFLSPK